MLQLWTFPKSTDNTLVLIQDETIYVDTKKEDDLTNQIQKINAAQAWEKPHGMHFVNIEKVFLHKNRLEIHQKEIKKTLFIDDSEKINEIFTAIKTHIPTLQLTVKRVSVLKSIWIQTVVTIGIFIRLITYLVDVVDIGERSNLASIQEYYSEIYGNFIYTLSGIGTIGIVIIAIIYILLALFFINSVAENRPYIKELKRN
ncbi:MAG: hypothetical protein AB8B65_05375 [Kordia sp.]|uniref:hypothetical protein n=1 Tax=Kordia sp. TaxID=1965332 RepID=UPI00385C0D2D